MKQFIETKVSIRDALPLDAPKVRYPGFKQETVLLKKGTKRMKKGTPLPCDILLERDVEIILRDGTKIYADVFRPPHLDNVPSIMAISPYGKQLGGQWLDDVPFRAGVPQNATSRLERFEGPDPAYWVDKGYAIINPDARGSYMSEGIIQYFGTQYAEDGYDIIEWIARQEWSNKKVGMSGNSWLAISQWFIASLRPPHLCAIAPWEGLNDCLREIATRGGVPMPEFIEMLSNTFAGHNGIEDPVDFFIKHPTINEQWNDKIVNLSEITAPAYVVASYTNGIHTYGTLEGYQKISSTDKWLRIHNTGEWDDYYNPENIEDIRLFFDYYLNAKDNNWPQTPKVRLSVLNPGGKDIVNRPESEYPLARTELKKLYLDNNRHQMVDEQPENNKSVVYNSSYSRSRVIFKYKFSKTTEINGPIKVKIWASSLDSNDLDLHLKLTKLNKFGKKIISISLFEAASNGYIRASYRKLDENQSLDNKPFLAMDEIQKLKHGEIVPLEILLWPIGLHFNKGEYMQLTIRPYKSGNDRIASLPFGSSKLKIPRDTFTYDPNDKDIEFKTLGGNHKQIPESRKNVELPTDINTGKHAIYTGGEYDSYIIIPVV